MKMLPQQHRRQRSPLLLLASPLLLLLVLALLGVPVSAQPVESQECQEEASDSSTLLQLGSLARMRSARAATSGRVESGNKIHTAASATKLSGEATDIDEALAGVGKISVAPRTATSSSVLASSEMAPRTDRLSGSDFSRAMAPEASHGVATEAIALPEISEAKQRLVGDSRGADRMLTASLPGVSASLFQVAAEGSSSSSLNSKGKPIEAFGSAFELSDMDGTGAMAMCALIIMTVAVLVRKGAAVKLAWFGRTKYEHATSVRRRVDGLRIRSGTEIARMFASEHGASAGVESVPQPLHPGILVRVQGRIVAKAEGMLVGPFSGRPCALYSASVAQRRLDGVHQPPLAFYSASSDIIIQLEGACDVHVEVLGQEVALFDMLEGAFESEQRLQEAPQAWQTFVHKHGTATVDAAADEMQFYECALLTGALVSCVGEMARDRFGCLRLHPWSPSATSAKGETSDCLAGRIFISDHPELLRKEWRPWKAGL
eukprot:TRINITY_DN75286_c0_g1_i1.p1 TRINITY_DN75286_c0_g1~~TRINITY_DN75286_c0_g1_i1.p1  ORF type:complete len:489 (+),score=80.58 TRINITY_DN75286_c0_g1_i1:90-1556(+)